ncbi:class II fructose-bisphosphate aldolase family protein [soil metagenome]
MSLARTADLVGDAAAHGRAVAAFNVIGLEHAEAIALGAERAGVGAILQLSENAVQFHGGDPRPLLLACRAIAERSSTALSLHLDHVEDPALTAAVIAESHVLGVSSIMIDASRFDYAENVEVTAEAARTAHAAGLWVEAELGAIGGKDGAHAPGVRTDPVEAASFVSSTGVDALAVAVGSSHAMRDRSAALDDDLVRRIAAVVPVPLVLHGSSWVPDELIARAVAAGIRKVNVGTALNLAGTSAVRGALADLDLVDPRKYNRPAREAMAEVVAAFCAVVS